MDFHMQVCVNMGWCYCDNCPEEDFMSEPTFRDSKEAFRQAIEQGRLTDNALSPLYAGNYMYMGTWDGVDQFKDIVTREYLPARHAPAV